MKEQHVEIALWVMLLAGLLVMAMIVVGVVTTIGWIADALA